MADRTHPPSRAEMSADTRELHNAVDDAIRRDSKPFLHPDGQSIQLDLLGSARMIAWQEEKARISLLAEDCWSHLPTTYARYGSESTRALVSAIEKLEHASAAIAVDSGMGAAALLFDVLFEQGTHAVVVQASYNKTKAYLKRLAEGLGGSIDLVPEDSLAHVESAITEATRFVFVETYSNPLTRAVDVEKLVAIVSRARERSPRIVSIVDNTIATPWAPNTPLLELGVDYVISSGTKAMDGRDRNMWGYIASNRIREMNEVMDLVAMRGGILDWRRSQSIVAALDEARARFERRCRNASAVASFLSGHRRVSEVHHPSLPEHPDADVIATQYSLPGSLLSFRLDGADEDTTRHFCDVLAMTRVPRYALSFDGLVTKVNHHRSVSEYWATEDEARALGIDRLVRLGVGLEAADDLLACLDWALGSYPDVSEEDVRRWQQERRRELNLGSE